MNATAYIALVLIPSSVRSQPSGGLFDWSSLLPVAALILGFVLKWVQDFVTERKRDRRQDELRAAQRKDELDAQKQAAERANLLALQPLISANGRAMLASIALATARTKVGKPWSVTAECPQYEKARQARMDIWPIASRLHNQSISTELSEIAKLAGLLKGSADQAAGFLVYRQVVEMTSAAHVSVGTEIRRLEDPSAFT
jgi:hypothetical protein